MGETIDVGNRKMFIYDADDFTRKFTAGNLKIMDQLFELLSPKFLERLGLEQSPAASLDSMLPRATPVVHKLPDYNGFGSIEDSEQNCKKIVPGKLLFDD